jgi:hypothetical protein
MLARLFQAKFLLWVAVLVYFVPGIAAFYMPELNNGWQFGGTNPTKTFILLLMLLLSFLAAAIRQLSTPNGESFKRLFSLKTGRAPKLLFLIVLFTAIMMYLAFVLIWNAGTRNL